MTWRMPPLALIERPTWTRGRTTTMYLMYGYLFVAVVLLFVKAVELATAVAPGAPAPFRRQRRPRCPEPVVPGPCPGARCPGAVVPEPVRRTFALWT